MAQAQRESVKGDADSGEDESPVREKPQRPPNRRKKSKEALVEEDIIDGFAILGFRSYEDLEVSSFSFFVNFVYPTEGTFLCVYTPISVSIVYLFVKHQFLCVSVCVRKRYFG